jgi:hypothetical protein
MTPDADKARDDFGPNLADDEDTGLPVFRTWRALYLFVAVVFAGCVAVLYALTRKFS